jgi:hypothetical protein
VNKRSGARGPESTTMLGLDDDEMDAERIKGVRPSDRCLVPAFFPTLHNEQDVGCVPCTAPFAKGRAAG